MQCRDFEDRLNDLLDARQVPERDAILRRHAGECQTCRHFLDAQAALFTGMDLLETPPLPSHFAATVLKNSGSLFSVSSHRPKSRWLAVAAGLSSLAAIVLVAVLIDMASQRPKENPAAVKPASPIATPSAIAVANDSDAKHLPTPESVAHAVVPPIVPPEMAAASADQKRLDEYQELFSSFTAGLPSAAKTMDDMQQSTPAIRPLRASFSMAIGTLQRTIPSRSKKDSRPLKPNSGYFGFARVVTV